MSSFICSGLFKAELQASAQKDEDMALQGGRGGSVAGEGWGWLSFWRGGRGGWEMRVIVKERGGDAVGGVDSWAAGTAAVGGPGEDGKSNKETSRGSGNLADRFACGPASPGTAPAIIHTASTFTSNSSSSSSSDYTERDGCRKEVECIQHRGGKATRSETLRSLMIMKIIVVSMQKQQKKCLFLHSKLTLFAQ